MKHCRWCSLCSPGGRCADWIVSGGESFCCIRCYERFTEEHGQAKNILRKLLRHRCK